MAKFEDVVTRVKDVADAAVNKTGEWVEIGKIKLRIAELRREIEGAHEGLGRLVYDSRRSGEDAEDMIDACVEHIAEMVADMEDLEEKIMETKNVVRCKECGAINDTTAVFCNQCAAKLN